jgi:hypothetical protein
MAGTDQVRKNLRAALKDALRIQSCFIAEPIFSRTGRGYWKSNGVETLQKIQANLRSRQSCRCKKTGLKTGPGKRS